MNALLWWLTQNTLTVAVMLPFVLVGCRLFRRRPAVQHVLWVVVLLKFVTPPLVTWPWTVQQVRETYWASRTTFTMEDLAAAESVFPSALAGLPAPPESLEFDPLPLPFEGADPVTLALWLVTLCWLAGTVLGFAFQLRRIVRHAALVRRATPAPDLLTEEIQATAERMGLRPPRAVLARGILSPFMWCLGCLRLVWPEAMANRADVVRSRGVLAHELAHVRRGDHWVAWIELLAGIVWWWNPLFWLVRARLRESADMACDALAIATHPASRREYAELLLELSMGLRSGVPAPVLAVSAGTPSSFERRLSMILCDRVSGKLSSWGILAAVGLAFLAFPAWSLGQQKEPPKRASVADDPVLRELIEQGKFGEAKARLEALRGKQATDKAIADGVFPEKWRSILAKELPAACLKGMPQNATLSWKACTTCHLGHKEGVVVTDSSKWKVADPALAGKSDGWQPKTPPSVAHPNDPRGSQRPQLAQADSNLTAAKFYLQLLANKAEGSKADLDAANALLELVAKSKDAVPGRADDALKTSAAKRAATNRDTQPKTNAANPARTDSRKKLGEGVRVDEWSTADRSPLSAQPSALDLGEKYLRANAEFKKAKNRLDQLASLTGVATQQAVADAKIEYERAEKQQRLVATFLEDALHSAEAALARTTDAYKVAEAGFKTGTLPRAQLDAPRANMEDAQARLKQLKSILSVVK